MSAYPLPDRMSLPEYLAWEARQSRKHELIDGRPIAMAGASKRHNLIASNLIRHLGNQLAGGPCRPYGSDTKLLSPTGNARYPDVQVDCARLSSAEVASSDPRVVIEVLSPSNDWLDVARLKADYQAHEAVAHVVFVSSLKAAVQIYTRDGEGWRDAVIEGLEGVLDLSAVGARLAMAEIYDAVDFEEADPA